MLNAEEQKILDLMNIAHYTGWVLGLVCGGAIGALVVWFLMTFFD